MNTKLAVSLAVILTSFHTLVRADIIYTTFVFDDVYDATDTGVALGGNPDGACGGVRQATSFTLSSNSYALSSITLPLNWGGLTPGNFFISILSDKDGLPRTNQVVDTFEVNGPDTGGQQIVTFTSSLNPILSAGNTYWVMFEPGLFGTNTWMDTLYWLSMSFAPEANAVVNYYNPATANWDPITYASYSTPPTFRLDGTLVPVPEPATLTLLGLGLGSLWFHHRRRQD